MRKLTRTSTVAADFHLVSGATDQYGDTSTLTEAVVAVVGCLFEPQQAAERAEPGQPDTLTPAKVYAPPSAPDVDSDDYLVISGRRWDVVGASSRWGDRGLEIPVRRWSQT